MTRAARLRDLASESSSSVLSSGEAEPATAVCWPRMARNRRVRQSNRRRIGPRSITSSPKDEQAEGFEGHRGGLGEEHPWQTAGRRRTPVPAARDSKRGRRDTKWEQRSVPRPLPCLDHQLSKSSGTRRRMTSPASLIPPSLSLSERASRLSKTSSCRIPCPQSPVLSRSKDAKPPPRRVLRSSRLATDRERLIPRSSSLPERREWTAKGFSSHVHSKK
jgi:hypothetical protein